MNKYITSVVLLVILTSCKDDILLDNINDGYYLGKAGTVRVYQAIYSQNTVDTDKPIINVPINLIDKVSFTKNEIENGVYRKSFYSLGIVDIPRDYFLYRKIKDTTGYRYEKTIDGWLYDLKEELDSLQKGSTIKKLGYSLGSMAYKETSNSLLSNVPSTDSIGIVLKYPLEKNKSWTIVNGSYKMFAIVDGIEKVIVPAGVFNAYKISIYVYDIYDYSTYSNGTHLLYTEYWCPNVGLVLRKGDSIDYKNNLHYVSRTELTSYKYLGN